MRPTTLAHGNGLNFGEERNWMSPPAKGFGSGAGYGQQICRAAAVRHGLWRHVRLMIRVQRTKIMTRTDLCRYAPTKKSSLRADVAERVRHKVCDRLWPCKSWVSSGSCPPRLWPVLQRSGVAPTRCEWVPLEPSYAALLLQGMCDAPQRLFSPCPSVVNAG